MVIDQARGHALGTWLGGNTADTGIESPARPHRGAGGWPDENGPRRRDRRTAWRGRIRLCDSTARRIGLHHDAQVSFEYLPGWGGHAGPGAAQEIPGKTRARNQLLLLCRRRGARADGAVGYSQIRRIDRPLGLTRDEEMHRALEGEGPRLHEDFLSGARCGRDSAPPLREP